MSDVETFPSGPRRAMVHLRRRLSPAVRAARSATERFRRDENGATILTFALMFVVLLGFASLVTDVGSAYWNRRMLQNAVDGAALAGAESLPASTSAALSTAKTYAASNGVSAGELSALANNPQVITVFNPNDALYVAAQRTDNFGLRYTVGGQDVNVDAGAIALVVALAPNDIWPIAAQQSANCTAGCTIKFGSGGSYTGNFGLLSLGANGNNQVEANIESGFNSGIPAPTSYTGTTPNWNWTVLTATGNKESATQNGIAALMGWDQGKFCDGGTQTCASLYAKPPADGYDYSPQTSDGTICLTDMRCPRVGIVPIISQNWVDLSGNSSVTVVGFQCYYLQTLNPNGGGQGHASITAKSLGNCFAGGNGGSPMYNVPLGSTGSITAVLWR